MRRVLAALAAVVVLVALSGCGEDRTCEEWHTDTVLLPVMVGKVVTLIPQQTYVCDRYAGEAP